MLWRQKLADFKLRPHDNNYNIMSFAQSKVIDLRQLSFIVTWLHSCLIKSQKLTYNISIFQPAYSRLTAHIPDLYIILILVIYSLMTTTHLEQDWTTILESFNNPEWEAISDLTLHKYQKYW